MAVLNAWQRPDRVLSGKMWGDAKDGSATISSCPNTVATVSGTATQYTGVAGSTAFADGDLVILWQTQGTGYGQWEFNMVVSGGGTTSLVFKTALQYTYGTGAQIIKVPRYTTATVSAHSIEAWNGSVGGVEVIVAKTNISINGAINGVAGYLGAASHPVPPIDTPGTQGEGTAGPRGSTSVNANGNGGGAGQWASENKGTSGGGGGGNATAGATAPTAYQNGGSSAGGTGGIAVGASDLITICLGGGGGSGACNASGGGGAGGMGGGILILISKTITIGAGVSVNGVVGSNGWVNGAGGGGGAGGSILVVCETATLGTNNATATAGGAGTGTDQTTAPNGGAGSAGRIAIHHKGTVSGSTSPAYTDVSDATLFEKGGIPNVLII